MALTPLTRVQQATVLALVEARRLDVVPADLARATSFLRQAEDRRALQAIPAHAVYLVVDDRLELLAVVDVRCDPACIEATIADRPSTTKEPDLSSRFNV